MVSGSLHAILGIAIAFFLASPVLAKKCDTCPRDSNGRIQRSTSAIKEFKRANPCPATGKSTGRCSGWVVDHKKPLCAHGLDIPDNLQWQSVSDAKAKDRLERQECVHN